jgi:hypothetical protein
MKKAIHMIVLSLCACSIALGQTRYKSITWENFKRSGPDLKQIGWLAIKSSNEIQSSPWSVGCETLDRDYADFSVYKDYVGELGIKHARLQSGWAKCEKEKGVYDFDWLDRCVYGLTEQGVEPWICLCYGNPLYGSGMRLGSAIFTSEETMAAWCNYVEATVRRYKDVVSEWEVWNEPKGSDPPEVYANLLIRSAESIRKVQPDATILAFSVHSFSPGVLKNFPRKVFDILKAKDKLDLVDYVTYHPYTRNPDECYPMVEALGELVRSYNPKIKLYQGECGCPSILEWGHALSNYPWTEYSQAKWVLRRMAGDRVRDIRSSVFTIIDLRYPNMLQSFGLIRSNLLHEIIYKRPVFYGVQHMAGFFDGTATSKGELQYQSDTSRKMTIAGFEKMNRPAVLIWYKDQIPSDDLKWDLVNLKIEKLNFNDPAYVEMITGKVYKIDRSNWKNEGDDTRLNKLPIWDSPIMIAERSLVELRKE